MKRIEGEWRYFDEALGIPYPWYTKPCLEYLEKINFFNKKVWEFGVGDSTIWYRFNGAIVYGVDNNLEWASKLGASFQYYRHGYLQSIGCFQKGNEFDIICIDGVWRDECTEYSLRHLKPGGILIIDNYKQKSADMEHWPITEKLIEGMEQKLFKEPDHADWQTLIVFK